MSIDDTHAMRLRPDQVAEIAKARRVRELAEALRGRVALGSYGDVEHKEFLAIAGTVSIELAVSNTVLGRRAGLGDSFFSSLARESRRPKLPNFLKALSAIIDVSNERLHDVESRVAGKKPEPAAGGSNLIQNRTELFLLASVLAALAKKELDDLAAKRPNDLERRRNFERQTELLQIFATGFSKIAYALRELERGPTEPALLGKASRLVAELSSHLSDWWRSNGSEAIDWAIRIPILSAAVAVLGLAGADKTIATAIAGTMVGGQKIADVFKAKRKK